MHRRINANDEEDDEATMPTTARQTHNFVNEYSHICVHDRTHTYVYLSAKSFELDL